LTFNITGGGIKQPVTDKDIQSFILSHPLNIICSAIR